MKILFISDFLLEHSAGGAQRSNSLIIDAGELRGHEIHQMHYQSNVSTLKLIQLLNDKKYDYVISSNLEQLGIEEGLIDLLHMLPNHVRLEHDMCMYLTEENRYRRKRIIEGGSLNGQVKPRLQLAYIASTFGSAFQVLKWARYSTGHRLAVFAGNSQRANQTCH